MKMDTAADEATAMQLERLELLLMDPTVRRHRERVAGSSGRVWTRAMMLEQLPRETYSPPVVECFTCRMLGEDVALVTYRAVRSNGAAGERTVTLRSSIWVRMSGNWKMRFHQGTRSLE